MGSSSILSTSMAVNLTIYPVQLLLPQNSPSELTLAVGKSRGLGVSILTGNLLVIFQH
jgi:hypothetical protein